MIYIKIFCILSIIYLFFCLFLLSYSKYKRGKNPFIIIDKVTDNIEKHIMRNEIEKLKNEEEEAINDFKSMS